MRLSGDSPAAFDFFCGIGGLTRGFLNAGIRVVAGIDVDPACRKTYEINNPESTFVEADIREISTRRIRRLAGGTRLSDMIFAGCAPCQPFSKQRKSGEVNADATLLRSFGEIIESCRPAIVFIENVPGLAAVKGFSTFKRFLKTLTQCGYTYKVSKVNAKSFGVPQSRERLILVASRVGEIGIPEPTHGPHGRRYVTVRDAISHLPPIKAGQAHPTFPNHRAAALSSKNLKRIGMTHHDGGDRSEWPSKLKLKCHKNETVQYTDVYGRMRWDSPAPTLTGRCNSLSNGRYGHPAQNRAISLREAAALQTFPDEYIFFGVSREVAQHIGNAVPVRLAEVMGRHLLHILKDSRP